MRRGSISLAINGRFVQLRLDGVAVISLTLRTEYSAKTKQSAMAVSNHFSKDWLDTCFLSTQATLRYCVWPLGCSVASWHSIDVGLPASDSWRSFPWIWPEVFFAPFGDLSFP